MYLPAKNLDDRKFQELVNDAKKLIPQFCPTWTDHNVSDPGITLVELFAWMTEQLLYRLNQVPDKNYVTFLDLIGVRLAPPIPARGEVTFELTAPVEPGNPLVIPQWTEAATERTETEEAVVFTTDVEAEIRPASLTYILTVPDKDNPVETQDQSETRRQTELFKVWPTMTPSNALYLGFIEDLSSHSLLLSLEGAGKGGLGPDTRLPAPWLWEVWRNDGWTALEGVEDTTRGLNENGSIRFYLPTGCAAKNVAIYKAKTWLRCSPATELPTNQTPYTASPQLDRIRASSVGITVPVTHAQPIWNEDLGVSDGQPAQRFTLRFQSILNPEQADEVLEVEDEQGQVEVWQRVADFGQSRPGYQVGALDGRGRPTDARVDVTEADKHYVLDPQSGIVEFGPAIRQPNGSRPQFGAIPPRGARIRMRLYRTGGGVQGNVAADKVKTLKTTLPYVAKVFNRDPITGGLDAQSLEDAKFRAPARLRTRQRAVTAEDYEYLALEVPGVGRARCLQPDPTGKDPTLPAPGEVRLLVIPELSPLTDEEMEKHIQLRDMLGRLPDDDRFRVVEAMHKELTLKDGVADRLRDKLNECRVLTTRLDIKDPDYIWVSVYVKAHPQPRADRTRVQERVKAALYTFLHPVYGGPDGRGWPFGQSLRVDTVYALLRTVEGVNYVSEVQLYQVDMSDRVNPRRFQPNDRSGAAAEVSVPPNGVVISYVHDVAIG